MLSSYTWVLLGLLAIVVFGLVKWYYNR